jgi:hypothetical protein
VVSEVEVSAHYLIRGLFDSVLTLNVVHQFQTPSIFKFDPVAALLRPAHAGRASYRSWRATRVPRVCTRQRICCGRSRRREGARKISWTTFRLFFTS